MSVCHSEVEILGCHLPHGSWGCPYPGNTTSDLTKIPEVLKFLPAGTCTAGHKVLRASLRLVSREVCTSGTLCLTFCKLQLGALLGLHSPGTQQARGTQGPIPSLGSTCELRNRTGCIHELQEGARSWPSRPRLTRGCEVFQSLLRDSFALNRPALLGSRGLRAAPQRTI